MYGLHPLLILDPARLALAMKITRGIFFFLIVATLGGCAAGPRTVEPVPFYMVLSADSDINPDVRGRPSPVVVRVYELRNGSSFESADFFSLFDKEQAVLGADLIQRDEVILRPTDTRHISRRAHPDTRVIGIAAAYRNLERGTWRTIVYLPPPVEIKSIPVIGPLVTRSPREQQILVQFKYQSVFTSQGKASWF